MKKKADDQEKILDEIRQKVLEESENLKAEKERLLNEKVTLEALQEMTDLPMDRITEISFEVKNRYKKKQAVKKDERIMVKNFERRIKEKAHYVKIIAENVNKCPEWHKGAGGKAWLFVDEIVIE